MAFSIHPALILLIGLSLFGFLYQSDLVSAQHKLDIFFIAHAIALLVAARFVKLSSDRVVNIFAFMGIYFLSGILIMGPDFAQMVAVILKASADAIYTGILKIGKAIDSVL